MKERTNCFGQRWKEKRSGIPFPIPPQDGPPMFSSCQNVCQQEEDEKVKRMKQDVNLKTVGENWNQFKGLTEVSQNLSYPGDGCSLNRIEEGPLLPQNIHPIPCLGSGWCLAPPQNFKGKKPKALMPLLVLPDSSGIVPVIKLGLCKAVGSTGQDKLSSFRIGISPNDSSAVESRQVFVQVKATVWKMELKNQ